MNNNFVFQFHNGSIKRFFKSTRYIQKNWFQFHNGSIKSETITISVPYE